VITLEQLRAQVADGRVEEVVLALPDLAGRLQGTRVSAHHFLDQVLTDGLGACGYLLTTDVDLNVTARSGELDPDRTGYGDMLLVPDLDTMRPLPWDPGCVQVLTDARHRDGTPVQVAPRHVLRAQVEALAAHGLVPFAGFELEFRVFTEDYAQAAAGGWSGLTPATRSGVDYALVGMEQMDRLTRRLRRDMTRAGLSLESARGECAPGQYEIVFGYDQALRAADQASFYKTAAKQIAAQEGMSLTFMPKYDEAEGNSCHVHLSLRAEDGDPVFVGDGTPGRPELAGTSHLLQRALAGQLACLRELTLLFAPTVNAYKRLRPGSFAPTTVSWGRDNRLAALRLLGSGQATRFEHRVPGGDADPHLVLAGLLLATRHGLESPVPLPRAAEGFPGPGAERLPASLDEATTLFEQSEVARKGLGDGLVDALVSAARAEIAAHAGEVTAWERARGFERR
jgi:glutamine synthetase